MPGGKIKKDKRKRIREADIPSYKVDQEVGRLTRSLTKAKRDAVRQAAIDKILDDAAKLKEERAKALALQPPAPAGQCGDGKLHIAFIRMGQGDCTLISTPKGRFVIIDCGSDATEDDSDAYLKRIRDTISGKKFMGGTKDAKQLDVLILTHADTDHYNKLKSVLRDDTIIHNIYHSDKIESYADGNLSGWLKNHVTHDKFIYAVTVKADVQVLQDKKQLRTRTQTINNAAASKMDLKNNKLGVDERGTLRIVDDGVCQISILASNFEQDTEKDNSQGNRNRGSVVTLIEAFGKRIVICGDATRSTEKFLIDEYGNLLADLDLLQVPHHGSNVTSSSDLLVTKLKPKKAILSAGKEVQKDHLPSQVVIDKYLKQQAKGTVPKHEIFYWTPGAIGSFIKDSQFTEQDLYTTGSNLTIELVFPS
jgi:beta-lactamase superfamily II metal-dependent hydrolase